MAKLYEIDKAIEDLIDKETGEITDEAEFEKLKMDKEEKVQNIALLILNLRSDAKEWKGEEEKFKKWRQQAESHADWLTDYLKRHLNGESITGKQFRITWRKSISTDVFDESKVPVDYKKWQPPKVDKDAIGRALKAGQDVPGARLVERQNMSIK